MTSRYDHKCTSTIKHVLPNIIKFREKTSVTCTAIKNVLFVLQLSAINLRVMEIEMRFKTIQDISKVDNKHKPKIIFQMKPKCLAVAVHI